MDLWVREARIFKYGSGTGTNFSALRGEGEPLSGGGKSSGLMSFLKIGDRAAGAIKSGGTTRRAAKMVVLDLDHPDIEEFINWKVVEEQKVAALVTGSKLLNRHLNAILKACHAWPKPEERFDRHRNTELRKAIAEAQAVLVPANYIERVHPAGPARVHVAADSRSTTPTGTPKAYYTVSGPEQQQLGARRQRVHGRGAKGRPVAPLLAHRAGKGPPRRPSAQAAARRCAPASCGTRSPTPPGRAPIPACSSTRRSTNGTPVPPTGGSTPAIPCSEYMFLDDTACNLASLNLLTFYDAKTTRFDVDSFRHATRLWTLILEISVYMAQFPSVPVAQKSYDFRTLGLGYANMGSLLMVQGIPYDSPKAGDPVRRRSRRSCTRSPTPRRRRSPPRWGRSPRYPGQPRGDAARRPQSSPGRLQRPARGVRRADHPARRHRRDATVPDYLLQAARRESDRMVELGEKHGYRNAQVTCIAPTGTIALVMDCDTTGVEPDFALVKFKKLAGGGYFKIINASIPPALERLGYTPRQIEDIVRYCRGTGTLEGCPHINRASLRAKGFSDDLLQRLEAQLPGAFELSFVFNRWTVGDDFLRKDSSG